MDPSPTSAMAFNGHPRRSVASVGEGFQWGNPPSIRRPCREGFQRGHPFDPSPRVAEGLQRGHPFWIRHLMSRRGCKGTTPLDPPQLARAGAKLGPGGLRLVLKLLVD